MENKNKTTFTFTDREILLLSLGLLDFISAEEEAIDDCYSRGDIKAVEKHQDICSEFNLLFERFRDYVDADLFLEKGLENYGK